MALLRGRLVRALAVSAHGGPWGPPSLFSAPNQFGGPVCKVGWGVEVKESEPFQRTFFRTTVPRGTHVEFPLAQTGEGIAECEIIKWFVEVSELGMNSGEASVGAVLQWNKYGDGRGAVAWKDWLAERLGNWEALGTP